MLRSARLVMMILIAMFIVAVPTAVAQTPVGDQYAVPSDTGVAPTDDAAAAGGDSAAAPPVQVRELTADKAGELPFTGGQISLVALIGLALLAAGAIGLASARRRASAATT